jgi:hypothetical protein
MPDRDVGSQKLAYLLEADVLYLFEYRLAGGRAEALLCDAPREGQLREDVGGSEPCDCIATNSLDCACDARVVES